MFSTLQNTSVDPQQFWEELRWVNRFHLTMDEIIILWDSENQVFYRDIVLVFKEFQSRKQAGEEGIQWKQKRGSSQIILDEWEKLPWASGIELGVYHDQESISHTEMACTKDERAWRTWNMAECEGWGMVEWDIGLEACIYQGRNPSGMAPAFPYFDKWRWGVNWQKWTGNIEDIEGRAVVQTFQRPRNSATIKIWWKRREYLMPNSRDTHPCFKLPHVYKRQPSIIFKLIATQL